MATLTMNDIQALSLAMLSLDSIAARIGGSSGQRLSQAKTIILEVLTSDPAPDRNADNRDGLSDGGSRPPQP